MEEMAISMDYKVIRKELCRYQLDQFRTNLEMDKWMIAMIGKFSKFHKSSIEIIHFYRVMIEKCRNMTNEQEEEEKDTFLLWKSIIVLVFCWSLEEIGKSANREMLNVIFAVCDLIVYENELSINWGGQFLIVWWSNTNYLQRWIETS